MLTFIDQLERDTGLARQRVPVIVSDKEELGKLIESDRVQTMMCNNGIYIFFQTVPQDNSRNEWAFQKAVTIQTYSNYHPIPVPFNIISTIVMCAFGFRKKAADEAEIKREQHSSVS